MERVEPRKTSTVTSMPELMSDHMTDKREWFKARIGTSGILSLDM